MIKNKLWMLGMIALLFCGCTNSTWQEELCTELSAFGHRNWIVVADAAYPKQSAPGIKTIATGNSHIEVLEIVLNEIEKAPHVQAIVLLDNELDKVSEEDAPGLEAYKVELKNLLKGKQVKTMPHEEIISELDKNSKLFNVLLLKTNMVLPYTSVFMQLDCGYWGADKEKKLRESMAQADG